MSVYKSVLFIFYFLIFCKMNKELKWSLQKSFLERDASAVRKAALSERLSLPLLIRHQNPEEPSTVSKGTEFLWILKLHVQL